ncbi:hypothetical protein ACS0TY_034287 [Phlomoides rotata]
MAGEETAGAVGVPLRLVHDVVSISAAGFSGFFKKDCANLGRRVTLLAHLLEEMRDSKRIQLNCEVGSSSFSNSLFADLILALQAAKRLVAAANNFDNSVVSSDDASKKIFFQFQCVTYKLEKALANLPYNDFDISEEVQEQVELIRSQLGRATERYGGPLNSSILNRALSQPLDKEIDSFQPSIRLTGSMHVENVDGEVNIKVEDITEGDGAVDQASDMDSTKENLSKSATSSEVGLSKEKPDSRAIPDDFRCPISLELMRDPVIVATGQTYERSYIQRWIDCGNTTCPKTRQKLRNLTLTPNYVLRSLISQWCAKHDTDQPRALVNGRIKKSDGSFRDVTGDIAAMEALFRKLSNGSANECRAAISEIRSLSKRSTDNRVLLAEAGAIPIIVNLLTSDDAQIQENAITSILNLSIYDDNRGLIMLANAIPSIVQVLKNGSVEAKENAAATLFSLSIADENKIIIGASGAIPSLVDLLENGSQTGKKDAATALFNLCIYHGNKGRAVRAGIITALLKMLTESSSFCMADEALTILSVIANHQEAKTAIVKAGMMPILVDVLRVGLPRCKENAAAVLLSLCKRDAVNLACVSRLGAGILLAELAESGTDRTKRKATSLLEHLRSCFFD